MKSILGMPLSAESIWQSGFLLLATYLIFAPPLANPQSTAIALGGGLLLALFTPLFSAKTPQLGFCSWAFLGYALLSFTWSCQPGVSLVSAGFLFLAVLLFLSQAGWEGKTRQTVEYFGLLLALVASAMALEQRFYGLPDLTKILPSFSGQELEMVKAAIHNQRAFGPLVTPGALAALVIFFIPQAFIHAQTSAGFKKTLLYTAILFLAVGLWTTQSVGALASLTLAVLVVLALRRSYRALGLVLLLGLAGVLFLVFQRGLTSWHLAAYSMRLELWSKAWQLFLMKPWGGWGLGCFGEAYQNLGYDPNTGSRFAHDLPLQVLVELGIPGMVLLLLACFSIIKRLKPQPRWEAWGVGTGLLSVFFFSLIDLPFQMPEMVVLFAAIAGRIELKGKNQRPTQSHEDTKESHDWDKGEHQQPTQRRKDAKINKDFNYGKKTDLPQRHRGTEESKTTINGLLWQKSLWGLSGAEWLLLAVFLVTGFWPPFRPGNFLVLAGTLWVLAGLSGKTHGGVRLWTLLGVLFFIFRALASPSASGCVWFFEIAGILLAFITVLPALPNKERFLRGFGLLGLAWALKVWWETFHYNTGGLEGWIHFQYSDVKDWIIFPDPKQIGLFLIPLLFVPIVFGKLGLKIWEKIRGFNTPKKPANGWGWAAALAALFTVLRLKSEGGFLGFVVGSGGLIKKKYLPAFMGLAAVGLVVMLAYRSSDSSSTKWGRFEIWDSAVKVFAMNPVIGEGPGAFTGLYHRVKEPREGGVSRFLMDARYAHNEALEALAAFGLVGFVLLLLWLIRLWPGKDQPWHKASVLGLLAASLTDFCLHTPLMALWGAAFLNYQGPGPLGRNSYDPESPGARPSLAKGFLVLGIALALFAPPCFIPALTDQFQADIQANHLPQALRLIETTEALNPWDVRLAGAKLDFLEKLYLATGDETWRRRADEAQGQVIDLETTDGTLRFEKAQRLTRRNDARPGADNLSAVQLAWREADKALPTNAFVKFEEGAFYYNRGPGKKGIWDISTVNDGARGFPVFPAGDAIGAEFRPGLVLQRPLPQGHGRSRGGYDGFRQGVPGLYAVQICGADRPLGKTVDFPHPRTTQETALRAGNQVKATRSNGAIDALAALILILALSFFYAPVIWGGKLFMFVDSSRFFYPLWKWGAGVLSTGRLPLWNPDAQFGSPFLADPQMAYTYPPVPLLFGLFGADNAFACLILFHHFWALFGFWRFARREGMGPGAALFGSIAFGFSLHVVCASWTPVALFTISWIPWTIQSALSLYRGQKGSTLALSFCAAMELSAGYPVLVYLTALSLGVGFIIKSITDSPQRHRGTEKDVILDEGKKNNLPRRVVGRGTKENLRRPAKDQNNLFESMFLTLCLCASVVDVEKGVKQKWGWLKGAVIASVLSLLYNLCWMLPFAEFFRFSNYEGGGNHLQALGFKDLATLLAPFYQGHPLEAGYQGPHYWISTYYLGLPVLVMVILGAAQGLLPPPL